jgi:hypothetical protein
VGVDSLDKASYWPYIYITYGRARIELTETGIEIARGLQLPEEKAPEPPIFGPFANDK